MNRKGLIALLGVVIAVAVMTQLYSAFSNPPEKEKPPVLAGYCPDCGLKLPGNLKPEQCPNCLRERNLQKLSGKTVATGSRLGGLNEYVKLVLFFLICAVWVLLVVGPGWLKELPWLGDEVFHLVRCPKCSIKMRYPASKIGKEGICPGCKHGFLNPDPYSG